MVAFARESMMIRDPNKIHTPTLPFRTVSVTRGLSSSAGSVVVA
jgi:hypothetical protein